MGVQFKFLAWELEGRSPWLATCLHLVTLCLWASALPWQRETLPFPALLLRGQGDPEQGQASAGKMIRARA